MEDRKRFTKTVEVHKSAGIININHIAKIVKVHKSANIINEKVFAKTVEIHKYVNIKRLGGNVKSVNESKSKVFSLFPTPGNKEA